jgi:SanA protein
MMIFDIIGSVWWIDRQTQHLVMTDIWDLPNRKVGIVFGTSQKLCNGRQNLYFTYRIQAAVALRKAQKIDYLLVSGDNGSKSYDEPTAFKNALLDFGIPADRIVLDYAWFSTLDSILRADRIFSVAHTTLITQPDQAKRALLICQYYQMDCIAYPAKDVPLRSAPRIVIREWFAKVKVVLDLYLLNTQPIYAWIQEDVPWR